MTDDELRLIVREAIARHMGSRPAPGRAATAQLPAQSHAPALASVTPAGLGPTLPQAVVPAAGQTVVIAGAPGGVAIAAGPGANVQVHISHAVFAVPPARDGGHDGPCATEPGADCTHCGFCQSFGH